MPVTVSVACSDRASWVASTPSFASEAARAAEVVGVVHADFEREQRAARSHGEVELRAAVGAVEVTGARLVETEVAIEAAHGERRRERRS